MSATPMKRRKIPSNVLGPRELMISWWPKGRIDQEPHALVLIDSLPQNLRSRWFPEVLRWASGQRRRKRQQACFPWQIFDDDGFSQEKGEIKGVGLWRERQRPEGGSLGALIVSGSS